MCKVRRAAFRWHAVFVTNHNILPQTISSKFNIRLLGGPVIPLLGIAPREMKAYPHTDLYIHFCNIMDSSQKTGMFKQRNTCQQQKE